MFAILFWYICCWPSWKSKTTTRVRPLSQADRARQLYATLLARAHTLTLSQIHTHTQTYLLFPDTSLLLGYSTVKPALIQTILCVCVHQFSVHVCARERRLVVYVFSFMFECVCVCVRYTHICQPLDLQRLRCAYESGQSVLFNVHLATIHKLYQVLQRRMTDIV